MNVKIIKANIENEEHQHAIVSLLNSFAIDLKGYNKSLPEDVLKNVIPGLKNFPTVEIFLAEADSSYVGMAICFVGFSTFYAKPLINIHDFTVMKDYRNLGIGKMLVDAIVEKAKILNCCKITLEVQEKNISAISLYEKCGFERNILDDTEGQMLFLSKKIH